jgi:hypothetical protein
MTPMPKINSPQILTASWYSNLPSTWARVSISRGPPRGQRGFRRLPILAPGAWFRSVDEATYVERYARQLAGLDPRRVLRQILECGSGAPGIALICFERPATGDGWCHRALAASWLAAGLGIVVPEYGFEHLKQEDHPMLPPSLRSIAPNGEGCNNLHSRSLRRTENGA